MSGENSNGDMLGSQVVAYAVFMEPKEYPEVPWFTPYPKENWPKIAPPYENTPLVPPSIVINIPQTKPEMIKAEIEKQLIEFLDASLKRAETGELLLQYSNILKTLQKL